MRYPQQNPRPILPFHFWPASSKILSQVDHMFRFFMLSSSLCRIWTYESNICTGLQSRKLAEAIFTFSNVEASRKCFLQEFVMLSFTFALETMQSMYCNGFGYCAAGWLPKIGGTCFLSCWAVINTMWRWFWYGFGKRVHVLCGSLAEENFSRGGTERPPAHLHGR